MRRVPIHPAFDVGPAHVVNEDGPIDIIEPQISQVLIKRSEHLLDGQIDLSKLDDRLVRKIGEMLVTHAGTLTPSGSRIAFVMSIA